MVMPEIELFRRLESRKVVDFTLGLGLGTLWLFEELMVADAGRRGGGMLSCFGG